MLFSGFRLFLRLDGSFKVFVHDFHVLGKFASSRQLGIATLEIACEAIAQVIGVDVLFQVPLEVVRPPTHGISAMKNVTNVAVSQNVLTEMPLAKFKLTNMTLFFLLISFMDRISMLLELVHVVEGKLALLALDIVGHLLMMPELVGELESFVASGTLVRQLSRVLGHVVTQPTFLGESDSTLCTRISFGGFAVRHFNVLLQGHVGYKLFRTVLALDTCCLPLNLFIIVGAFVGIAATSFFSLDRMCVRSVSLQMIASGVSFVATWVFAREWPVSSVNEGVSLQSAWPGKCDETSWVGTRMSDRGTSQFKRLLST